MAERYIEREINAHCFEVSAQLLAAQCLSIPCKRRQQEKDRAEAGPATQRARENEGMELTRLATAEYYVKMAGIKMRAITLTEMLYR